MSEFAEKPPPLPDNIRQTRVAEIDHPQPASLLGKNHTPLRQENSLITHLRSNIQEAAIEKQKYELFPNPAVQKWFHERFPRYEYIKTNMTGRHVVIYNPSTDKFWKVDLSPNGTSLHKEQRQIGASVQHALGIKKEEVNNWLQLHTLMGPQDKPILGLHSRYLGVTVDSARANDLIPLHEVPNLAHEVYQTAQALYEQTGEWNEDLNQGNVIINYSTGKRRIVIIDWIKSKRVVTPRIQATTFNKFLGKFPPEIRSLDTLMEPTNDENYFNMLLELQSRGHLK